MVSTSATDHSTASAEGRCLGHTLQVLALPLVHNGSMASADGKESAVVSYLLFIAWRRFRCGELREQDHKIVAHWPLEAAFRATNGQSL